ncbi:MAG: hypothetical protein M1286_01675 [Candidatus Marsarchaeota archaeon]|nr:hypothetical protein [Candidatus Marsarchaeota archaeon]
MRFKPTPELCYLAGLAGRSNEPERSIVGIRTQNDAIEERFIKYLLGQGVDTKKIMVVEDGNFRHIYAYHSKLARMIREILDKRAELARKRGDLAASFLAGLFDANGHVTGNVITIRKIEKSDELLLELLGVHTVNAKILNIRSFLSLIGKKSLLAAGISL